MYCFSVLLNSTSIEIFLINLKRCALIFGSEYVNNEVQCAINELEDTFKKLGEVPQLIDSNIDNINEELAENILESTTNSEEAMILSSCKKPFFAFFKQKLSSLKYCTDKTCPPNPIFQPKWIETMERKWLSMVPFWTNILRSVNSGDMSTSRNRTAGTIEAWNLILKRSDHPKHRKRPDLFLKEHYSIHFGRQLAYIDNVSTKDRQRLKVKYIICLYIQYIYIYTCIQKQLDKPKTKLLEEKWSKRSKKPGQNLMGHYQKPPKKDFILLYAQKYV